MTLANDPRQPVDDSAAQSTAGLSNAGQAAAPALLTMPPPDVAGWTACLQDFDIPILADTAAALEAIRANEDAVDANSLGERIATDPLMTLKLLAYAGRHRPARVVTAPETVTGVLVMIGISPFLGAFGLQPTVEDRLGSADPVIGRPSTDPPGGSAAAGAGGCSALAGLRRLVARSRRAASFALAFALHGNDHHAAAVHQAALLGDFAELLLWCRAPLLAQRMAELQRVDPALRDDTVQRVVLNARLPDVQRALAQIWQLPELLLRVADDPHAQQPSVRSVRLALRLARHATPSLDATSVADDVADAGRLLRLSADATVAWLRDVDPQAGRPID